MRCYRAFASAAWLALAAWTFAQTDVPPAPPSAETASDDSAPPSAQVRELSVNAAGLIDVHLRDVPLADALRLLSQRAQRNITVADSVTGHVTSDLYQVTLEETLEALLTPTGYAWFPRGKFIYVCKPEERDKVLNANRPLELRVFELEFIPAAEVLPIVTKLLSPQGSVTSTVQPALPTVAPKPDDFDNALNQGLGGRSRAIGEVIVIRDYPEALEEIAAVVARLDKRPRQVLIEAVILRARLDDSNALGVDFNVLGGIDFRSTGSASIGVQNLVVGPVPPPAMDDTLTGFATNVSADVPPGGFTFGLISNDVATFIRALEEVVDLTIVANPKILAVNEQPGKVIVGRRDGYLTTLVTETAAIQQIEYIETGTQILFRPFIGADGYIRMDIHPEDSSGGLTPANLPFKDTTEVTTNVLVKDGHTLVIGGLFRDLVTSRKTKVPWLGHIPILGYLFSGELDENVREEVIILITPHIIEPQEAAAASELLLEEVERWRVLSHRGLLPWGRERLAQAHYRWALEHYRAGNRGRALWDAELALSLNPRFVEADRLRAALKNEPTEEADFSLVRDLVRRIVADELLRPTPDVLVPPPPADWPPAGPLVPRA
ncbi:MAG: hypothetical protein AB1716_05905, partial [Planctomycetota bacterium]